MKSYKIILTADENFAPDFSIESGKHDGKNHFDHHGIYKNETPVALQDIEPLATRMLDKKTPVIQITHFDADTYISLLKLINPTYLLYHVCENLIPDKEIVYLNQNDQDARKLADRNLEKLLKDTATLDTGKNLPADNIARLYSVGLKKLIQLPRCTKAHQDVTDLIPFDLDFNQVVEAGKEVIEKNRVVYNDSIETPIGYIPTQKIALFNVSEENTNYFNPLSVYYDFINEIEVCVIYREKYKTITISLHPEKKRTLSQIGKKKCESCPIGFEIAMCTITQYSCESCPVKTNQAYQTTVAGIDFFGHDKVAGTERGINFTFEDAQRVFEALTSRKGGE